MIRFKDVTKVVLVLALCFGFAGVSRAEKFKTCPLFGPVDCAAAQKDYINSRANCMQARYIKGEHEKCAKTWGCDHSASEEAANDLDSARYCAKVDKAKKFVEELCDEEDMDELMGELEKKAYSKFQNLPRVNVNKNN
ncbi:MAG: hypothetical protein LE180_00935 [Endomicrobium sp.]|uniref:hypothetical protein n=1 Tax=Candidatus Endomicrobiellum pyrsonymphae TaxID=1408203 RepID=UPI00358C979C|nr:hypothetical protein [Endomicrobium sp.]